MTDLGVVTSICLYVRGSMPFMLIQFFFCVEISLVFQLGGVWGKGGGMDRLGEVFGKSTLVKNILKAG